MAQWFRFYSEALDDPKVQKLPPALFKHWVNLLCLTSRHDGSLPPATDIAFALRTTESAIVGILDDLVRVGLLDHDETGLRPHNWRSRQHVSDVSTARVKRFRERFVKRDETVSVTPPDTETESETEKNPPTPRKRGDLTAEQSAEFEDWYAKYPHKVGRGAAERAWAAARALASTEELKAGVVRYVGSKRPDVAWCNPATWLNAKRWMDSPADTTPAGEQSEVSQADRDARRAKWATRLDEYRQTGKWQTAWGSEPWSGNTGCLVPLDMRAEFDNARMVAEIPDNLRRTA